MYSSIDITIYIDQINNPSFLLHFLASITHYS